MDYQVWNKEEYDDIYRKVDCGDLPAAKREIEKSIRDGKEPLLTVTVPYEYNIKISEVGSEVKKGKAKPNQGSGAEGNGEVRRGDKETPPGLDKGGGDNSAGDRAGD